MKGFQMPRIEIEVTDDELWLISELAKLENMSLHDYIIHAAKSHKDLQKYLNFEILAQANQNAIMEIELSKMGKNLKETENRVFMLKTALQEKQLQERERYSLLAEYRHGANRQRKMKAIVHFEQEHTETGISKNQFAKQYADKYHVAEKTLREWLKNCEYPF